MVSVPFAVTYALATLVSAAVVWRSVRARPREGAVWLALAMAGVTWWAFLSFLQVFVWEFDRVWILLNGLQWIGIGVVSIGVLALGLVLSDRGELLTRPRLVVLAVIPAVGSMGAIGFSRSVSLLMDTVPTLSPLWQLFDFINLAWPWLYWVVVIYIYGLLAVGSVLVLATAVERPRMDPSRLLLLGMILVPWSVNLLYQVGIIPFTGYDPTVLGFVITGLAGIVVVDRFQLFDVPLIRTRIVEQLSTPLLVIGWHGQLYDYNKQAARLLGLEKHSLEQDIRTVLDGTDITVTKSQNDDVAVFCDRLDDRHVELDSDGKQHRFLIQVSSLGSSPLDTQGYVIQFSDITSEYRQREQLEQRNDQLETSRERYRSLFESNPLVLWEEDLSAAMDEARTLAAEVDDLGEYLEANPEEHRQLFAATEVIDVNENAVEAYGATSKRELLDRRDERLTEESLATSRRLLQQLLDGECQFREETSYRTLDGDTRHVLFELIVPDAHAEDWSRVYVVETDISDQKQREEELRYQTALFESLNESTDTGILVTNTDREVLWYNNRFCELWGIPLELSESGSDRDLVQYVLDSVADPEAFVEATEKLHEPPYEPEEMELQLTDGRWFQRYTAPIVDDEGTRYGLLTLTRDITDQKEYQRRIELQNQRLERLAQVISHDLQTPLSTASKHLMLLDIELDDPPGPVEQSLADLERTHDRIRQFTDHLPRLARESTSVESTAECELATVAKEAWGVVETGSLRLEIEGEQTIQADPRRLQQLFENLFGNVAEHAVEQAEEEATTVWVEINKTGFAVADDGPGVPAGNELFDYGMSTGGGSGIGLAIVRSIVEAHGWEIDVTNREDGGARFVITMTETGTDVDQQSPSSTNTAS